MDQLQHTQTQIGGKALTLQSVKILNLTEFRIARMAPQHVCFNRSTLSLEYLGFCVAMIAIVPFNFHPTHWP